MKVLVITGSAHGKGTSALMADEFIRGAKDAGRLAAKGVMTRADIEAADYPQQAYVLGTQLN